MQGDISGDGYQLLARLRRLETRMARLQERWTAFRADPRPGRLRAVEAAFTNTDEAIRELALRLGTHRDPYPGGALPADPHVVIESGRALDDAVGKAQRAWQLLRRQPDPEGLARLADRLARAEAAAGYLAASLPGGASDPPGGRHPTLEPDDQASTRVDALMDRVRADWQKLRRSPGADSARVLQGELGEARVGVEELRSALRSDPAAGATAAPHLPVKRPVVRFAPYRDAFTGLYNREGFDALAGAELKKCRRYGRSFGLLLIEVQPANLDELRRVVGSVQGLLRGYDLVSRYGDDRLAVGLPETGAADARRIAARLLRAMEDDQAAAIRRLSYALLPDDGVSLSRILQCAEERLAS